MTTSERAIPGPPPATPARIAPFDEAVEEWLAASALAHPRHLSLGTGMAGVLLASARLMQLRPTAGRAARVRHLVATITDSVSAYPMQAGLWSGVVGVLYALEYVYSIDPLLLGEYRQPVRDFVDEMDEVLAEALDAPSPEFDLVLGQCGIGTYALMRTDTGAGQRLYAAAERALERSSEPDAGGRAWRVPPHKRKPGPFDLGVAHGTPGVIGMLAHALRLGAGTDRTAGLLDDTVRWLLAQEDNTLPHSRFASFSGPSGESSRLAWCYGDLGIAAMAATAASVRKDPLLERWWRDLAAHRLAQPEAGWRLADDALCHGRAGVLHILQRLNKRGWDCDSAQVLSSALLHQLTNCVPTPETSGAYGLINGLAGVSLVLAESEAGDNGCDRPWHLCMLTPA